MSICICFTYDFFQVRMEMFSLCYEDLLSGGNLLIIGLRLHRSMLTTEGKTRMDERRRKLGRGYGEARPPVCLILPLNNDGGR